MEVTTTSSSATQTTAEGLTRRLIGLATSSRNVDALHLQQQDDIEANRGNSDDKDDDNDKEKFFVSRQKRPFRLCGKNINSTCLKATTSHVYQPLPRRMVRCGGASNEFVVQHGKRCIRSLSYGCSTLHLYCFDNSYRPTVFCAMLRDLGRHILPSQNEESIAGNSSRAEMCSLGSTPSQGRDRPLDLHNASLSDTESGSETMGLVTKPQLKSSDVSPRESCTVIMLKEMKAQVSSIHTLTLEDAETVDMQSSDFLENVLVDFTLGKYHNLPEKPNLNVSFDPPSRAEEDEKKDVELSGFCTNPLSDKAIEEVTFYLRFPNAESMQQRTIDQKERAERTSDFLESAKSLTLQLSISSRRGSLLSTSSYASSVESSYDTSMTSSTLTNSDRGRRQQRRGSFLAGSKIERFDNFCSSSRHDSETYKPSSSRRSSSRDAFSQQDGVSRRNSISSRDPQGLSEEETRQQQDMERIKAELGYEEMEVPIKSHSNNDIFIDSRQHENHGHLGTVEVTEQMKRSSRRSGSRRSSFVAGSKIEYFEGGKKSRRKNNFRASM